MLDDPVSGTGFHANLRNALAARAKLAMFDRIPADNFRYGVPMDSPLRITLNPGFSACGSSMCIDSSASSCLEDKDNFNGDFFKALYSDS